MGASGERVRDDRVAGVAVVKVVPGPGVGRRQAVPLHPGAAVHRHPERVVVGVGRDCPRPDLEGSGAHGERVPDASGAGRVGGAAGGREQVLATRRQESVCTVNVGLPLRTPDSASSHTTLGPEGQAEHEPPQSTPVSVPFLMPSVQVGQAPQLGRAGAAGLGPVTRRIGASRRRVRRFGRARPGRRVRGVAGQHELVDDEAVLAHPDVDRVKPGRRDVEGRVDAVERAARPGERGGERADAVRAGDGDAVEAHVHRVAVSRERPPARPRTHT